jgi:hypothetical protein
MKDKRTDNGGHSTKAVRPDDKRLMTKSELQDAYENLKPFLPEAILQLETAIKAGERWAVELWFKYYFGMPKQTVDNNTNLTVSDFNLKEVLKFDNLK